MLPENYTFGYGTGLENIKHIVEKYEGTMEIETSERYFKADKLLLERAIMKTACNISRPSMAWAICRLEG